MRLIFPVSENEDRMAAGRARMAMDRGGTERIKVLLATGYADASIESPDGQTDEFDVMTKPYLQAELARKVRPLLDGPTGAS